MELIRRPLDLAAEPQEVLRALRGDARPFALTGAWVGGGALLGSEPVAIADGDADPFARLDVEPLAGPEGAFGGGWVGHLGFALGQLVERLPPVPPRPRRLPAAALAFYDHVLHLDREGTWWFEALVTPERAGAIERRRAELERRLAAGTGDARPWRLRGMWARPPGYAGHRAAVADCVRRIAEGELFQANLCLRLEGELDGDPLDAFADAWPRLAPAHGAYLGHPWGALLSFSPELFLRRSGRRAWTAPIKGTAPRPVDAARARRNAEALAASAKDRSENVMIVDLMRNDLGRVARYGSIRASTEPALEAHPGLWHLVSRVEAELGDGATDSALVRAAFPPGSVTGAPKVQSLHVISALESTAREAYTGAIGYASPVAGLELNVVIRTFEVRGRDVWLGAGGGIVADSDPDAELAEALDKARPIVTALGATVPDPPRAGPAPRFPPRRLSRRPDPAAGVFETIAVRDGVAVALDLHLARLAAASEPLPAGLRARLCVCARDAGPGLHRLRVVAAGSGVTVDCSPADDEAAPVRLAAVCVPGGLGDRKWADREPLAEFEKPGVLALIVDSDGSVLEASAANVWAVEGERLLTPPADGRLLAGVTRGRLLEGAGRAGLLAVEECLDLPRLEAADAIVVTSAVRLAAAAALEQAPSVDAMAIAARLRGLLLSGH